MKIQTSTLDLIRKYAASATPGPWYPPIRFDNDMGGIDWQIQAHGGEILGTVEQSNCARAKATADYVVTLLNSAPDLLVLIDAYKARDKAQGDVNVAAHRRTNVWYEHFMSISEQQHEYAKRSHWHTEKLQDLAKAERALSEAFEKLGML